MSGLPHNAANDSMEAWQDVDVKGGKSGGGKKKKKKNKKKAVQETQEKLAAAAEVAAAAGGASAIPDNRFRGWDEKEEAEKKKAERAAAQKRAAAAEEKKAREKALAKKQKAAGKPKPAVDSRSEEEAIATISANVLSEKIVEAQNKFPLEEGKDPKTNADKQLAWLKHVLAYIGKETSNCRPNRTFLDPGREEPWIFLPKESQNVLMRLCKSLHVNLIRQLFVLCCERFVGLVAQKQRTVAERLMIQLCCRASVELHRAPILNNIEKLSDQLWHLSFTSLRKQGPQGEKPPRPPPNPENVVLPECDFLLVRHLKNVDKKTTTIPLMWAFNQILHPAINSKSGVDAYMLGVYLLVFVRVHLRMMMGVSFRADEKGDPKNIVTKFLGPDEVRYALRCLNFALKENRFHPLKQKLVTLLRSYPLFRQPIMYGRYLVALFSGRSRLGDEDREDLLKKYDLFRALVFQIRPNAGQYYFYDLMKMSRAFVRDTDPKLLHQFMVNLAMAMSCDKNCMDMMCRRETIESMPRELNNLLKALNMLKNEPWSPVQRRNEKMKKCASEILDHCSKIKDNKKRQFDEAAEVAKKKKGKESTYPKGRFDMDQRSLDICAEHCQALQNVEKMRLPSQGGTGFLDLILYFLLISISGLLLVLLVHIHCRIYSSGSGDPSEVCGVIEEYGILEICDDVYSALIPYAEPLVPVAAQATAAIKDAANNVAPHIENFAASCSSTFGFGADK